MPIQKFDPGQFQSKTATTARFTTAASQAEANMWGSVVQGMGRVNATYEAIHRNEVMAQVKQKALVDGQSDNFDANALNKAARTSADRVYQETATAAYLARVELNDSNSFGQINVQHAYEPEILQARMIEHVNGVSEKMPSVVAAQYKQAVLPKVQSYVNNAYSRFAQQERQLAERDVLSAIEMSEQAISEMGIPEDEAGRELLNAEKARYFTALDAAVNSRFMSDNEAAKRVGDVGKKQVQTQMFNVVQSSSAPLSFAVKVAAGKSGNLSLDALPAQERLKALQVAQQVHSANQQLRSQASAAAAAQRQSVVNSMWKEMLLRPDVVDRRVLNGMIANAQTSKEIDQASKMRDYLDNYTEERYTKDDPQVLADVSARLFEDKVDQDMLNQLHGRGLSTATYQKFSNNLEFQSQNFTNTQAYSFQKNKMSLEFREAPKKISDPDTLADMQASGLPGKDYLQLRRFESQERQRILMAVQEAAINKKINPDNSSELGEFFDAEMAKSRAAVAQYKSTLMNRQAPVLDRKALEYIENPDKFADDMKKGLVSKDVARRVLELKE